MSNPKNKNLLAENTIRRFMKLANIDGITDPARVLTELEDVDVDVEEEEVGTLPVPDEGEDLPALEDDIVADEDALALDAAEEEEVSDPAAALAQEMVDELRPVIADFLEQNAEISVPDGPPVEVPEIGDVDVEELEIDAPPAGADIEIEDDEIVAPLSEASWNEDESYEGTPSKTHPGDFDYKKGPAGGGVVFNRDDEERHYRENEWSDEDRLEAIIHHARELKHDEHYDKERADDLDEGKKKKREKDWGMGKDQKSRTRPGQEDYTGHAGDDSETHPGKKDFTTKEGDKKKTSGTKRGTKRDDEAYKNEALVNKIALRVATRLLERSAQND